MTPDYDQLCRRLDALERFKRRTLNATFALILAPLAVLALSAQAPPATNVVSASAFELHDGAGKVRARLFMRDGKEPALQFMNAEGGLRASLSVLDDGGSLTLWNESGQVRLAINSSFGPNLSATHRDAPGGELQTDFLLSAGRFLLFNGPQSMTLEASGPTLRLTDADEYQLELGRSMRMTRDGRAAETSAASITMLDRAKRLVWAAP